MSNGVELPGRRMAFHYISQQNFLNYVKKNFGKFKKIMTWEPEKRKVDYFPVITFLNVKSTDKNLTTIVRAQSRNALSERRERV